MICLDTNIIYHHPLKRANWCLRETIIEGIAIPMIVYNELLYTVGAKIAWVKYGVKGKYSFRKHIAKHGFSKKL